MRLFNRTLLNDCETFKEKIRQSSHNKRSSPSACTLLAKQNRNNHLLLCKKSKDPHFVVGKEGEVLEKGRPTIPLLDFSLRLTMLYDIKKLRLVDLGSQEQRRLSNPKRLTSNSSSYIIEPCSKFKRKSSFLSL